MFRFATATTITLDREGWDGTQRQSLVVRDVSIVSLETMVCALGVDVAPVLGGIFLSHD
jgi:hypothetical protein